jgi:hypothetical protein
MTSEARAQNDAPPVVPANKPKPPPYALPYQLRPAVAVTAVRFDSALALADTGRSVGSSFTTMYRVIPDLAPLVRFGFGASGPEAGSGGSAVLNPLIGVLYTPKVGPFRLAPFAGVALPLGEGGGNDPDKATAASLSTTRMTRSSLDNALTAVNYTTLASGIGLAYIKNGLTLQAEMSLFYGVRSRGASTQDAAVTNFTSGISAGYFVLSFLSIQAEVRHQRFLSTPGLVQKDPTSRDQSTAALGARLHVPLRAGVTMRPGLAYTRPIDDPMLGSGYQVALLDVPVTF